MKICLIVLAIILLPFLLLVTYGKITHNMIPFWKSIRMIKRIMLIFKKWDIIDINRTIKEKNEYLKTPQKGIINKAKKIDTRIASAITAPKNKKTFKRCKESYLEYIEFCNNKKLSKTNYELKFDLLITETEDLLYPEKALDRKLNACCEEYDQMYGKMSNSGESLLSVRMVSSETLKMVSDLINSIANHPKEFEADIKSINLEKVKFDDVVSFGKRERDNIKKSIGIAGAGAAAGTAVAVAGPSAALWVATTFGIASTGTAISALSGAAATNAALAWLGGGAVAAGGGGVAAGQALLALAGPIGIGIAGASAFTSILVYWKKKKKIQESKKQEIDRILNCTAALKELTAVIEELTNETSKLNGMITQQIKNAESLRGQEYLTFSDEQKHSLGTLVNNANSLAALLNRTVIEEE